jgi:hypothetical protein
MLWQLLLLTGVLGLGERLEKSRCNRSHGETCSQYGSYQVESGESEVAVEMHLAFADLRKWCVWNA